jgi:hypothetical protein
VYRCGRRPNFSTSLTIGRIRHAAAAAAAADADALTIYSRIL